MAQNFVIAGTVYNGVDSISMTNENGEKITYVEKVNAGTGVPVATIGSREFYTVEDALKAAVSGETVTMIADSTEPVILIIPTGVTLDIQSNTLTADRIIGLNGSKLMANTMSNSTESGSGFLKVKKDNVLLDDGCVVASNGYGILPVWNPDAGHYEFALMRVYDQYSSNGLSVTEDNIRFVFRHEVGGYYKRFLLNNGGLDNGVKVEVVLTWDNTQLVFTISDDKFITVNNATNKDHTFTLDNYSLIGVDLSKDVYITARIVTDCGMCHTLTPTKVTLS
jgi:hypothetical protein